MEAAFEKKTLDLIAGSPAAGKFVARIINLFVDDFWNRWKRNGTTRFDQT